MKKWLLWASALALLCVSIVSLLFLDNKEMGIQVINEKKLDKIQKNAVLNEEMAFSLCFQGESLPYDGASNSFFLPLSMQDSEWEQGEITGFVMNGEIKKAVEVLFLEDFLKADKLSLMAENRAVPFLVLEGNHYKEYGLKITGISVMDFSSTDMADENGLPILQVRVFDADKKNDKVQSCYTTSRLRGWMSKTYEKKGIRLNLLEEAKDGTLQKVNKDLLGLRKDDDWILNALYADGMKIKDKLANDLWNETGALNNPYGQSFGSDFAYVEMFVNGNYQGIYGLMYPIDRKQLGMESVSNQIKAGNEVIERIYKKRHTAMWIEDDFLGELSDPNSPDSRGGFSLKGDTLLQDLNEWEPLRQMAACINSDDETFSATITQIASQENMLDNWLFYQAVVGVDNVGKNYYYVSRNRNGNPYGYFIPWDLNLTFGDVYFDDDVFHCEFDPSVFNILIKWQPAQRMVDLNVEGSCEILETTWQKWRKSTFSDDGICDRIDALEKIVKDSGAYEREKQRWPDGKYDEDFSVIKDFMIERLAYVDEYIQEINK